MNSDGIRTQNRGLEGFAVLRLQGKLSLALQAALWDRLLSLPLPFFRDYSAGDLAQRSTAFAQMRTAVSGPTNPSSWRNR